jgi:hypothetical protein
MKPQPTELSKAIQKTIEKQVAKWTRTYLVDKVQIAYTVSTRRGFQSRKMQLAAKGVTITPGRMMAELTTASGGHQTISINGKYFRAWMGETRLSLNSDNVWHAAIREAKHDYEGASYLTGCGN